MLRLTCMEMAEVCVSHCDDVRGPAVESQAVIGQFQAAGVAQRSAAVRQEVRSLFGAQPHLSTQVGYR